MGGVAIAVAVVVAVIVVWPAPTSSLRSHSSPTASHDATAIGGVAHVSDLASEALREFADDSVDIGRGQEKRCGARAFEGGDDRCRDGTGIDVARVVVVAPAMPIPGVPASLTRVFRNTFDESPDIALPSSGTELDHADAGQTTKGLDATFEMAGYVAREAYRKSPASPDVIVVLNPDDDQVDSDDLSRLANAWAARGGPITLYRLPKLGLPHDLIDVRRPEGDTEVVYPILIDLLGGDRPCPTDLTVGGGTGSEDRGGVEAVDLGTTRQPGEAMCRRHYECLGR